MSYYKTKLPKQFKQFKLKEILPCIICGSTDWGRFAQQDYLKALECKKCGMISVNPYISSEGVDLFYKSYFSIRHTDEPALAKLRKSQYKLDRDFLQLFGTGGDILDIGCSGGEFLSNFDENSWNRVGVDLQPEAATYAKQHYGIDVMVGNVVGLKFSRRFDVIVMRGVIEHFHDPRPVMAKIRKLLKPGGLFYICATPAGDSFAFDTYRGEWRLFTPLEHVHFFSERHISRLLGSRFKLLISKRFYEETPYAKPKADYNRIRTDIKALSSGTKRVKSSAFPGSMINAIWRFKA